MNLPYAVSDTYSFFVLLITFGLIVIGFAIIIKSISELKESIDASSQMFLKIKNNLDNFKSDKKNQENLLQDFKSEITRIADGISGQDNMTKAIDLARNGENVEKIVSETGLSKSDAEALIKFHKR